MKVAVLIGQKKADFLTPMDYYKYSQSGLTKKAIANLSKNTKLPYFAKFFHKIRQFFVSSISLLK